MRLPSAAVLVRALVGATCFVFSACAQHSISPANVELIPLDREIRESVEATPTTFELSHADAFEAWRRAEVFFKQYTTGANLANDAISSNLLSNRASRRDRYIYEAQRSPTSEGFRFDVSCFPRLSNAGDPQQAQQNARNVARFIREGTLELSLLDVGNGL